MLFCGTVNMMYYFNIILTSVNMASCNCPCSSPLLNYACLFPFPHLNCFPLSLLAQSQTHSNNL